MKDASGHDKPIRHAGGRPRKPLPPGLRGEIAERVRTLRLERGWTSAQLANYAEIAHGTLLRLERGEATDGMVWVKVANGLAITPAELLNGCESWNAITPAEMD